MIRPADSDDEQDKSDEDDGKSVAVKDDPQFTLAVTRGSVSICDFFAAFHTLEFLNAKMITYKTWCMCEYYRLIITVSEDYHQVKKS